MSYGVFALVDCGRGYYLSEIYVGRGGLEEKGVVRSVVWGTLYLKYLWFYIWVWVRFGIICK